MGVKCFSGWTPLVWGTGAWSVASQVARCTGVGLTEQAEERAGDLIRIESYQDIHTPTQVHVAGNRLRHRHATAGCSTSSWSSSVRSLRITTPITNQSGKKGRVVCASHQTSCAERERDPAYSRFPHSHFLSLRNEGVKSRFEPRIWSRLQ